MFLSFEAKTWQRKDLNVKESIFKFMSLCWKILCFLAPTAMLYVFAIPLVFLPLQLIVDEWFFGPLGLVVILVFDVAWIIIMIKLPFKDRRLRKILIWFVLTVSASVLTGWLGGFLIPYMI
jgi:hypothetical protein